ncbi:peptidoglycan-binding domain-containing protein [Rhodobacter ferrooxidans]|uniref:Peptidoglycan-binding domain 1 protein n=1 Tax=Rhodobacter ferrooxidans TaxID=371731 RepID=C8S0F8_9RHOB|nr:peptidoglycan-binding domain-containing protein [Rhodobacter sp. SW2]EEW25492.1 Peptidoglycan-binding domain 1 protein [Rhodobacter sp. SW2]
MKFNKIASGALVATMALAPAEQAMARGGDLIGGLIVGGLIGSAIANDQNRRRNATRRTTVPRRSSMSSAQREANREVQVSLNYFGYPVGTPDGAIGPKSRAAISEYQVLLGYPPTGELTEYERTLLVTSYHRAVAGGPLVAQTVATHPMGLRGLLLAQRDEMAGISPTVNKAVGPIEPAAPVAQPEVVAPAAPALPVLTAAPATALPSFMGTGATQVSLASQCNKISLLTNTNGGYTTAAAMTDANFALGEQFCLARTYAMAAGEEAASKVAGFTPAQIAEQCQGFGPALKDHVAALSLKPSEEVLQGVSSFVLTSGMAPAQLAGTAKICLGVGYTTDSMDVAIGSALLLTALGEKAYAELLGHHLSQGFGAATRPDLALGWYEMGLEANQTTGSIFAPGLADRGELIRKAAFTINGRSDLVAPTPLPVIAAAPVPEAAPLPVLAPTPNVQVSAEVVAPAAPVAAPVAEPVLASTPATEAPAAGLNVARMLSAATYLLRN